MGETMSGFAVKDSGKREQFDSGMVRDTTEGKTDTLLTRDGPMFWRWAVHLTKGAVKYSKRNWMRANGPTEEERFKESAARHFEQWLQGETDEDHAAAVFFNINGYEYVRTRSQAVTAEPMDDITDGLRNFGMGCAEYGPNNSGFACTRPYGHVGSHAAWGTKELYETWEAK